MKKIGTQTTYITDDIEKVGYNKDVSVVYHNRNQKISPILTFVLDGQTYTKYNPEYVEYLKRLHPKFSDKQIIMMIEEELEKTNLEENDNNRSIKR